MWLYRTEYKLQFVTYRTDILNKKFIKIEIRFTHRTKHKKKHLKWLSFAVVINFFSLITCGYKINLIIVIYKLKIIIHLIFVKYFLMKNIEWRIMRVLLNYRFVYTWLVHVYMTIFIKCSLARFHLSCKMFYALMLILNRKNIACNININYKVTEWYIIVMILLPHWWRTYIYIHIRIIEIGWSLRHCTQ